MRYSFSQMVERQMNDRVEQGFVDEDQSGVVAVATAIVVLFVIVLYLSSLR